LRCHPLEIAGGAEARQMRELCRYIEEHAAGRLGGDAGRLGGDAGRLGGDAGRLGGDAGRLGGAAGRLDENAGRLDGDAGRLDGDAGWLDENAGRLGGDTGRLDLAALAARAGLSRFHLQRRFKAIVGVTPREYGEACRMRRLKSELRQSKDVTEAVYAAGFSSSSRVYERADTRLGMTPNQYRRGGEGMAISYASAPTPVGLTMLAATDRGLCFLQFGESEEALAAALHGEYPAAQIAPMSEARGAEFREWMEALRQHLEGQRPQLDLPLDIRATAFQMRVWNYLQGIPYGQVRSYAQVAAGIGSPTATRAVARACASNTVALAIPCHRVIRGSGELGGYRWGLARKQALLGRERARAARSA
jgi:AraC family transcriptional regulator of adaptative response/methylated-DNA-[protein]-cysteine methyltransferase